VSHDRRVLEMSVLIHKGDDASQEPCYSLPVVHSWRNRQDPWTYSL
jgi:hypothetical protein